MTIPTEKEQQVVDILNQLLNEFGIDGENYQLLVRATATLIIVKVESTPKKEE